MARLKVKTRVQALTDHDCDKCIAFHGIKTGDVLGISSPDCRATTIIDGIGYNCCPKGHSKDAKEMRRSIGIDDKKDGKKKTQAVAISASMDI